MACSPTQMRDAIVRNLPTRTGKSLEQWVRVAKESHVTDEKTLRKWLKAEHDLGGPTCVVIAEVTLGSSRPTDAEALDTQFKGDKATLRPVYDGLVQSVRELGKDVNVGVRKTQTTFSRTHTFAIAKAPTRTRIDLGLRLPGVKPTKRLQATTAFSDNATHCVSLTASGDVDTQLVKWLKAAYDARG